MTDILESIRRIFVPIHKEGYPFILIALVATIAPGLALVAARLDRRDPDRVGLLLLPRSRRGSRRSGKASSSRPPTGG